MATRYQRQRAMDTSMSSYSRDSFTPVRERSSGYTHNRSYTRSTKSAAPGLDLANMCKYHSSAPVRYSIHPKFQSRFLWRKQNTSWMFLYYSQCFNLIPYDFALFCLILSVCLTVCLWLSLTFCDCLTLYCQTISSPSDTHRLFPSHSVHFHLFMSKSASISLILSILIYSCLFMSIHVYSCLFLSVPLYSCLFLYIPIYSCRFLYIPVYSSIFPSIPSHSFHLDIPSNS